jgi:hypothetical protein
LLSGWQQRLAELDESADLAALEAKVAAQRKIIWPRPKNCRPAAKGRDRDGQGGQRSHAPTGAVVRPLRSRTGAGR